MPFMSAINLKLHEKTFYLLLTVNLLIARLTVHYNMYEYI